MMVDEAIKTRDYDGALARINSERGVAWSQFEADKLKGDVIGKRLKNKIPILKAGVKAAAERADEWIPPVCA